MNRLVFRDCLTALFLIPDFWILKQRILTLMSINKQSKQISRINSIYQWKLWQRQVCKLNLVSRNQISVKLCRYLGVGNPLPTTHTVEHIGSILTKCWSSWQIHWLFKYKLKEGKKRFQYTPYLSKKKKIPKVLKQCIFIWNFIWEIWTSKRSIFKICSTI